MKMFAFFASLLVAGFAFGSEGSEAAAQAAGGFFTPGSAIAIAAGLCGLGQSKAIYAACEGMARNPSATGDIRTTLLLGLAFIESLVLFTFAVAWVKG
jgi:F-type H+-transporting ATPase subunit c